MAAFVKFQQFVEDLAHGVHDLETDQLVVALSNGANPPSAGNDSVLAGKVVDPRLAIEVIILGLDTAVIHTVKQRINFVVG